MRAGASSVGHPVDVATGVVWSDNKDVDIPGKVDLTWGRRYSTALLDLPPTSLGPGWTARYFTTLTREDGAFRFFSPEGDVEVFVDPQGVLDRGGVVRNLGTFQELSAEGEYYVMTRWEVDSVAVERYLFAAGKPGQAWPLARIEDVTGQHALEMLRDRSGRLTGIRQWPENRTLVLGYDARGRLDQVALRTPSDHVETLVQYGYDSAGRLVAVFDALGNADRYEYDAGSRISREILKDGGVFFFKYDDRGRCVLTSGLDRYDEQSLRYMDAIQVTQVTDSYGAVTVYQRTKTGQIARQVGPLGATRLTDYDEYGRIVAMTAPDGGVTRYEYDGAGNRCKICGPDGRTATVEYNKFHQPVKMTDPAGNVWYRKYDERNRWVAAENPLGHRWKYEYDRQGNLVHVVDPTWATRHLKYSPEGVLTAYTDWADHWTHFAVNTFGRVTRRTDCAGNVTKFTCDRMGRLVQIEHPDGARVTCQYDSRGHITAVTNANGQTRRYRFGTCGRLVEMVNPLGHSTRFVWGRSHRRMEKVINPKGEVHTYTYDLAGRLVEETTFGGDRFQFRYDLSDRCVVMTNGVGESITYEYDLAGRMTRKTYPDGSTASFEYDAHGNVVAGSNAACTVQIERNALGQVVREVQGPHVLEYEYDPVGAVSRVRSSLGHEAAYQYDSKGFLESLLVGGRHRIDFAYDCRGREVSRSLPGDVHLEQRYGPRGQLLEQQVTLANNRGLVAGRPPRGPLIQRNYRYDPAGNLITMADARLGDTDYAYDPAERLLRAVSPHLSEEFAYDGNGNITRIGRKSAAGTEFEDLEYEPGNRLVRRGQIRYVYDDHGRLVKKIEEADSPVPKEWVYRWDADDQLVSVRRPDGEVWTYTYDAFGRRIGKLGPTQSIGFVWDKDVILHQLVDEAVKATWIFDTHSNRPLVQLEGDSFYAVITDHLGTPRELLDVGGSIVWEAQPAAWGEVARDGPRPVNCPIRFPGQWFDEETGLHYSWFRYYDPLTGQFLSLDPFGLKGGINEYLYGTNPINWIDPWGLKGGCDDDSEIEEPVIIVIDKNKYPEAAQHIQDNQPVTGRIDRKGAAARRRASLRGTESESKKDRDEVPPAVLDTGGAGASVRKIDPSDNRGAGSTMGHQMRDLPDRTLVQIVAK